MGSKRGPAIVVGETCTKYGSGTIDRSQLKLCDVWRLLMSFDCDAMLLSTTQGAFAGPGPEAGLVGLLKMY